MKAMTVLAICLAFAMSCSAQDGSEAPAKDGCELSRRIHAFYYPWYGNPKTDGRYEHWNHRVSVRKGPPRSYPGGDDIGASFYPAIGCYSSNSDADLAVHMRQLRRAGVGVIAASWWGKGSYTDRATPKLLDMAAQHGIQINFHIEPFGGRNAKTTREAIVYIVEKYGSHPAFYRSTPPKRGNRPMFYVYDSYLTSAGDWATILSPGAENTIRNTKFDSVVIGLWVKEHDGRFMLQGHFDGFYTYFAIDGFTYGATVDNWPKLADWARQNNLIFIPSVGPGYEDRRIRPWNGRNSRSREDGVYYDRMFKAAIDVDPPIISITSFNEWHEGTQIEPAAPKSVGDYKYLDYSPHPPEYYLDRTRYWCWRYSTRRGKSTFEEVRQHDDCSSTEENDSEERS